MAQYRLSLPDGPFGTVLADPPWRLNVGGVKRKLAYDSMSLDDIKAMGTRIKEITIPDAHLWLWTSNPHLPEALEVMESWGFTYKGMRVWCKSKMGLGFWLRSASEPLLLGVRSNKLRQPPGKWRTWFQAPYRGHSVKPEEAIECIQSLSPAPYLELFARNPRPDWTCLVSDQPPVGDPYGQG